MPGGGGAAGGPTPELRIEPTSRSPYGTTRNRRYATIASGQVFQIAE